MNHGIVRLICFRIIQLMGIILLLPILVALWYREWTVLPVFVIEGALCAGIGTVGIHCSKKVSKVFYAREGFVVTAVAWILISLLMAIPFRLTGVCDTYVDALFETVSGLTTTGATILRHVNGMYYSVQFLRTFSHWIGGMGVLVFIMAVLPMAGGYGMHLMRAESPGPSVGKFVPKVKDTSRILYGIYLVFTVTETIALLCTGRTFYEALTLTFSTVGTGGFGLTDAGIGGYNYGTQVVITVFMILCGINFGIYYLFITKRPGEALKSEELRWYLGIMLVSSVTMTILCIRPGGAFVGHPGEAFHHSLFNVASVMTTTGFATLDYNGWPELARTIFTILTFLGACAGSTGGGFKLSRLVILLKVVHNEVVFLVHPTSVRKVSMDGHTVEGKTVKSVCAYLALYVMVFLVSWLLVSVDGFDTATNLTAVAATLNNVGPGLNMVGPAGNYADYSNFSKIVLMVDMLAGRLELLPVLILMSPRTVRRGRF